MVLAVAVAGLFRRRIQRRLGLGATLQELKERDLRRADRCQRCGYDLTMIESVQCPECGEVRLYPPRRKDEQRQQEGA